MGKNLKSEVLKSEMKQNWTQGRGFYYDQYHFKIEVEDYTYKLYWKEKFITETHSLGAAKEISTVLLNDKILAG